VRRNFCFRGFSLLEVLISLGVLSFGLLAAAELLVTAIRGNSFSHHLTDATILAEAKLEELKNLNYFDSRLAGSTSTEPILRSGILYTRQYSASDMGLMMKMISVTVQWRDRTDHQITLATIRSRQQ
jgi:prepilin-type N-terminal cleavage/methylation domain-containing protein